MAVAHVARHAHVCPPCRRPSRTSHGRRTDRPLPRFPAQWCATCCQCVKSVQVEITVDLQQAVCAWETFEAAIDLTNLCRCARRHYLRAVQNNLLQPASSLNCLSHVRNASGNQIKASMPVRKCLEHFEGRALRTLPLKTDPQHQEVAKVRCARSRNTDLCPDQSRGGGGTASCPR